MSKKSGINDFIYFIYNMNVNVRTDGTIDRSYRPYINNEEYDVFRLYDPYGSGISPGGNMYERNQRSVERFCDHHHRYVYGGIRESTTLRGQPGYLEGKINPPCPNHYPIHRTPRMCKK